MQQAPTSDRRSPAVPPVAMMIGPERKVLETNDSWSSLNFEHCEY